MLRFWEQAYLHDTFTYIQALYIRPFISGPPKICVHYTCPDWTHSLYEA